MEITRRDQVWSSDITYIPMRQGFFYLTAVIDWHSRYVLAWRLSNTLDGSFCHEALDEALSGGRPEVFNTDQGAQFTAEQFLVGVAESGQLSAQLRSPYHDPFRKPNLSTASGAGSGGC